MDWLTEFFCQFHWFQFDLSVFLIFLSTPTKEPTNIYTEIPNNKEVDEFDTIQTCRENEIKHQKKNDNCI